MFGLKKLFSRSTAAAKRLENKDEFEAYCHGGVGICFADGSCEPSEIDTLKNMLHSDKNLTAFQGEIDVTIDNIVGQFNLSPARAKLQIIRELSDLKADQEAKENVLATLFDLASLGGVEESEKEVLREYAKALGLSPSIIGL